MRSLDPQSLRNEWSLSDEVVHLNHGSFGLPPIVVSQARAAWIRRLEAHPEAFYQYEMEDAIRSATACVADWVGAQPGDIALVDNATVAMNAVAVSRRLAAGDQVLITDHDYGAVHSIWQRACRQAGADLVTVQLPFPPESDQQIVDCLCDAVTDRTRLAVFSHITSPSAMILPVEAVCQRMAELEVATCVDGPHGVTQLPVQLANLNCDYYTASLHKWTCAPLGSGFLYAHPRVQADVEPADLSWGRLNPKPIEHWNQRFWWRGTRDISSNLAVPVACEFLTKIGLDEFRQQSHRLAALGADMLSDLAGCQNVLDADRWHAGMVLVQIPDGDPYRLRDTLFHQHQITIAALQWSQRRYLRISCHLYNNEADLQKLVVAVDRCLRAER